MDNTGGDLSHAAKEVEAYLEKPPLHSTDEGEILKMDSTGEKQKQQSGSSRSSSQDRSRNSPQLAKLDSQVVKIEENTDDDEAYAHLPPHEKAIIKKQLHVPSVSVNYKNLFRYATRNDLIIIYISALCAIAAGAAMPLMTVSFWVRTISDNFADSCKGYLRPIDRYFHGFHAGDDLLGRLQA